MPKIIKTQYFTPDLVDQIQTKPETTDLSNPVDLPNQGSNILVSSQPMNNSNNITNLDARKDIGNSLNIGYSTINVLTKTQPNVKPITVKNL